MPSGPERLHLPLPPPGLRTKFRAKGGGGRPGPPERDRVAHAARIRSELRAAVERAAPAAENNYLAVRLSTEDPEVLASLGSSGAELAAVLPAGGGDLGVAATVIVPAGRAEAWLEGKLSAYETKETKKGRPRNERLIANVESLAFAGPEDIFTGRPGDFPAGAGPTWWQVWLDRDKHSDARGAAGRFGVHVAGGSELQFPDSVVVLARATKDALAEWMRSTGAVHELALPENPAILGLDQREQAGLADDLRARLRPRLGDTAVCLLDVGVTRGHPLLTPAVNQGDVHAYLPAWPVDDLAGPAPGHGTGMAGLALFGDLRPLLAGGLIPLTHRLESVRILPPTGQNHPEQYGAITRESAARPAVAHPQRRRIFCMAVTDKTGQANDGFPTAWSGTVDQLCFGSGDGARLFILCAGNRRTAANYPAGKDLDPVESPAQAWNALTVGAFTEKDQIGADPSYAGWLPVAPPGGLSPTSRTSVPWTGSRVAPIKPDVVMEGGNYATDGTAIDPADSLQLLTARPQGSGGAPFGTFGDTSGAAALAARLAAQVWERYPDYWPETVRGLVVHSASWTPTMAASAGTTMASRELTLRRCGYGAPDPQLAMSSFADEVTLVGQHALQPFTAEGKAGDMVLYKLPWPAAHLRELAGLQVQLRVTLSYFIEPKPGRRGGFGKYQYPSHQLRFELKRSDETEARFNSRVNRLADKVKDGPEGEPWSYGKLRNHGSIHSDIWEGDAAALARRDLLAVFPASGWWKMAAEGAVRTRLARYALIVSLRVIEPVAARVDLYAEVENVIKAPIAVPVDG